MDFSMLLLAQLLGAVLAFFKAMVLACGAVVGARLGMKGFKLS